MLRDAGIAELQVNPVIHGYPPGHHRRSTFLDLFENARDALVREGFAEDEELDKLTRNLRRHLDDPATPIDRSKGLGFLHRDDAERSLASCSKPRSYQEILDVLEKNVAKSDQAATIREVL